MEWAWTNPTFFVAVAAFWVAWSNYRRNNFVVIRVLQCASITSFDAAEGKFHQFRVVLRNLGVPLFNLQMQVNFVDAGGFGTCRMGMTAKGKLTKREGQFAKGMVTEFFFRSNLLGEWNAESLLNITDVSKQRVVLRLFSEDYQAFDFKLAGRWDWAKRRWNAFAGRANRRLEVADGISPDGYKRVKPLLKLPTFTIPADQFAAFLDTLRRDPESYKSPPTHTPPPGWGPGSRAVVHHSDDPRRFPRNL